MNARADAAAILEFFEVPTGDAFDVAPEDALKFFQAKGLKATFSFADMMDAEHTNAFTVAKMMNVDMLGQVRASLDSALANGTSFREWRDSIIPVLQSGGWWGRKEVVDPISGQKIVAQLGSPWRLETIFRTNMQSAYAAGQWQQIQEQREDAPFLLYDAVDDFRTRPLHRAWDGTVLPVDSDWWFTHYPPNGYNCRCGVIQLSKDELDALGLQVNSKAPNSGTYTWTNPRTGEQFSVPQGIDPGFSYNVGQQHAWKQKFLLAEKEAALAASQRAAAKEAAQQAEKLKAEMLAAAKSAQQSLAAAEAKAMLARAKAKAEEASEQWAADQQLKAISEGKSSAIAATFAKKALGQLQKSAEWLSSKPTQKLAALLKVADGLKAQANLSSKVSLYKKALVEGKVPPPAAVKAFGTLSPEDQASLLAKVDAEKAAIEAKKKAEALAAAKAAETAPDSSSPPALAGLLGGDPPDPANMILVGAKTKGGTRGGWYQDTSTGQRWLVKFPGSEDAVRNEVLASKLYQLAGQDAPELHLINIGGEPAIASKAVAGFREVGGDVLARTKSVLDGFAVDAWLANWDVVGLNFDNTVLIGERAFRIDVGGSLRYRALGGLKGAAWGDKVGEIDSLRSGSNAQAARVFGKMTPAQIEDSVVAVLRVRDDDIRAAVEAFGPVDAVERLALVDRLIARKADLARRYPGAVAKAKAFDDVADAAQAQPVKPPRVTDEEQAEVIASRVNGYSFLTDAGQIEDHNVLVSTFARQGGEQVTRAFLKLLPAGDKALADQLRQAGSAAGPSVSLGAARDSLLAAVKSVNYYAIKNQNYPPTTTAKIEAALKAADDAIRQIDRALPLAAVRADLDRARGIIAQWRLTLEEVLPQSKALAKAQVLPGKFPSELLPDDLAYKPKADPATQAPAGIQWRKVTGPFQYRTASFDRSFAKETGNVFTLPGVEIRYEADLADGTRVVYFPLGDPKVAWSMQGVMIVDAPGVGADVTAKVFDTLKAAGLQSERAGDLERRHYFLNAFARIRLDPVAARASAADVSAFQALRGDLSEESLRKKLEILKRATGVDIEASNAWARAADGVRQAFGHGRARVLRPDLEGPEFEAFDREFALYHNPNGIRWDAGPGVFEKLKPIIEGGGQFASLTDRFRRGVPLSGAGSTGTSVLPDMRTGGGEYHFTRIGKRERLSGTGLYWRARQVRRADAITYSSDVFGETAGGFVEQNRQGQTIASLKAQANNGSNETIFKAGLSIFDDLEAIVLSSQAEVKEAIAWLESRGYRAWPDGRKLSDVVITKAQYAKKS